MSGFILTIITQQQSFCRWLFRKLPFTCTVYVTVVTQSNGQLLWPKKTGPRHTVAIETRVHLHLHLLKILLDSSHCTVYTSTKKHFLPNPWRPWQPDQSSIFNNSRKTNSWGQSSLWRPNRNPFHNLLYQDNSQEPRLI